MIGSQEQYDKAFIKLKALWDYSEGSPEKVEFNALLDEMKGYIKTLPENEDMIPTLYNALMFEIEEVNHTEDKVKELQDYVNRIDTLTEEDKVVLRTKYDITERVINKRGTE
jgi:aminopeptidase-like protein